jgi:predicted secreted protein
MLFINNKPLAFATSHTFNLTGNTVDIASKDHGIFGASEIGSITWEITSENLYCDEENGIQAYDTLYDAMLNREPITVVFGKAGNYDENGLARGGNLDPSAPTEWEADTTYRTGNAVITSLNLNANVSENATYSVTLTGSGAITKVTGN